MFRFCLDLGGTGTRGALFSAEGKLVGRAEGEAGALSLGAEAAERAIREVWARLGVHLPDHPPAANVAIWAGIAGSGLPGRAKDLRNRLSDFADVTIIGDGYASLLGATSGKPGALIAVGTGVGAVRLDLQKKVTALSGWGFPAGDLGSGAWIGLEFFRAALKSLDGSPVFPGISPQTLNRFVGMCGPTDNDLMQWHTGARPKQFAGLAPMVLDAAADGDAFCDDLLNRAAREIADVAIALRVKDLPVHIGGGLGKSLMHRLAATEPDIDWQPASGDAVQGLLLLAQGKAPPEIFQKRPGFLALNTREANQ
ncbi:MAG: hypothetical protein KDJ19_01715 [Hyphomicrobiaceae bacterium]|nr:hypothetical protein [Hyphomicrobiaceae bacterium]